MGPLIVSQVGLHICVFYQKFGSGKHTLVLFHGFGQDHKIFEPTEYKLTFHIQTVQLVLVFDPLLRLRLIP